ncbi:MAG: TetR/AcrR family transcriptional regulator [Actinomycetota bacterium]
MPAHRHSPDRLTRRPGAGRPRKIPRTSDRPVVEEIVGEASRLFARQGVTATTMAQIAEASGLQVSSIYYYFASKEDILERILDEVNRVPLDALAEATAASDDPAEQLHRFVRRDAAALCRFPFDINEIHRLASTPDGRFGRYWSERQELVQGVEAIVAAGIESGQFVDVDAHLLALTVLANDEASQNWYRQRGEDADAATDPDEIGAQLADFALRGLWSGLGEPPPGARST